jgi:F-type H+-transporting ATPase subunit b
MNQLTIILITLLISTLAMAAGGEGVPVKLVWHQTFNVVLMMGALVWFLKKPLGEHFKQRRELFSAAAAKADEARALAEKERVEIQTRLNKLESTSSESITRARAEAVDYKNSLIKEAQEIATRIKSDAEAAARLEVQKARVAIRDEIVRESLKMTRSSLVAQVSPEDHERLQSRFVEQLQVVQK